MKLRPDSSKFRIPKLKVSPGSQKVLRFFKRVLSVLAITLSILCVLLSISELLVYWIDASAGIDNYVDWTWSLIAPLILSAVFFVIAVLLNLDRIIKKKSRPSSGAVTGKLELPDLD